MQPTPLPAPLPNKLAAELSERPTLLIFLRHLG